MTKEFKVKKYKDATVYTLESASAGATGSGAIATASGSIGSVRRRDNLIAQEGDTIKVPVTQKPRQGPLRPQTGAGQHRDKKKEQKQGKEKHRKPFAESFGEPDHEISMAGNELQSIIGDAKKLLVLIKRYSETEGLEAWQQSKITKAADYIASVLRSIGGEQGALAENLADQLAAFAKAHGGKVRTGPQPRKPETPKSNSKPETRPAPKYRDPNIDYSDDYSTWAAGRRDTTEQDTAEDGRTLAKLAGGIGIGAVAAAGAPAIVGILGPLLGIPMAAYGAYSATKLGMKGVEKLWDMAAEKLGGDDKVAQYTSSKIAKLPPEQKQAAVAAVKELSESRTQGDEYFSYLEGMLNEDWQKVNRRDKTDGMSRKAVKAYRRENPGSKLKTAVTTKPSKLKKGGKAAKRRKSFCARMKGMKKAHAGAKTKRNPDSPINKALRRWNCEEDAYMNSLNQQVLEKLNPQADVDVWVQDFQKADPNKYKQFKNKTPQKKAQMAVAAHYAANEPSKKK